MVAPAPSGACEAGDRGCLPTAQECRDGAAVYTDGGEPGRGAVCVAADGRAIVYAAGDPLAPCGVIMVADQELTPPTDPNVDCAGGTNQMPGSTWREEWFPSFDETLLHASVFRPLGVAPDAPTPVILVMTPYSNSGGTSDVSGSGAGIDITPTGSAVPRALAGVMGAVAPQLFARGYTIAVVSMRGIGGSEGCDDFGGPDAQGDVKAAVEWAASAGWSTGKVGMWGQSAEGWTQVMALAMAPAGLSAVVMQEPPIDRYAQSYMDGVPYWATGVGSALRYARISATPPSLRSSPDYIAHWANGGGRSGAGCSQPNLIGSANHDPADPFWTARDLTARAARSSVPVFLAQGFLDSNVKPGAFMDLWANLQGPKRAWLAQAEHTLFDAPDNPWVPDDVIGRDTFLEEALRWLDTYVRELPPEQTGVNADPPVTVERADGVWRAEQQWPPADAVAHTLPVLPGSYLDIPGNAAEGADPARRCPGSVGGATGCFRLANGQGSWSFTPPSTGAAHLAGVPTLSAEVSTVVEGATVIALVYDVAPSGRATLLTRGATRIGVAGDSSVTVRLYPQDHLIAEGHRIGILLTGADTGWFAPIHTFTPVEVRSASLSVPLLASEHPSDLAGVLSRAGAQRVPISIDPAIVSARTTG